MAKVAKKKLRQTEKPAVGVEISKFGADDVGAQFADELRLPSDSILRAKGGSDLGIYEKLLADWQCYSTFQQRRHAIVSKEVIVDAGGEDAQSVKAADFWTDQIKAVNFDEASKKQMMALWDGFGPSELMYETDGKLIYIDEIRKRKARRFRFGSDDSLRLLTKNSPKGIVMPENKFWLTQAGSNDDDDPYGLGLGHYCYWPVWLKRNALRHWALFLETFARGRVIAKTPGGLKPEEKKAVQAMLAVISGGGTAAVSDNIAVEILEAMRNSGGDYISFCGYLDGAIAKIILSQTMTTDNGSSRAQGQVHADVKEEVIKADADLLCESFNRGPVKWVTEWNFPGAIPPRIWRKCEEEEDTKKRAETDKIIFDMGHKRTSESIQEVYGPGFVPVNEPTNTDDSDPGESDAEVAPEFAEGDVVGPSDVVVEEATTGDEWRPLIEPTVAQIESLLDDCNSIAEFRDRLGEVAETDPEAMVESLARVTFSARAAGRAGAEIEDHADD